jgi:hypothetical protein
MRAEAFEPTGAVVVVEVAWHPQFAIVGAIRVSVRNAFVGF